MIREENDCCGCAVPAYPCMGNACPNRHALHYYCDECGEEVERLWDYKGDQLCDDCVRKHAFDDLTEVRPWR